MGPLTSKRRVSSWDCVQWEGTLKPSRTPGLRPELLALGCELTGVEGRRAESQVLSGTHEYCVV